MDDAKFFKGLFYSILLSLAGLSPQNKPVFADHSKLALNNHFSQNGFLKIDGAARFIIGMYELPKDDERLREMANSGFNLVRVPQEITTLDRVGKHGLFAWICLGSAATLTKNDPASEQKLAQIINKFKDHPSLLVWELPDEALWNVWWSRFQWIFGEQQQELRKHIEKAKDQTIDTDISKWSSLLHKASDYTERGLWKQAEELYNTLWQELDVKNPHPNWKMSQCPGQVDELTDAISRGCRIVNHLDPKHIIWQNHAPRNSINSLRKYNQAVDAVGCDIYPVPFSPTSGHSDLKDTNLSSVGAYTDRMHEAAPGKSIWMVLQGFGWRDLREKARNDPDPQKGRRPNFSETRFMAYDAIVHGANAILYWGTHSIEKNSLLWRDLMKVARELRSLEPGIVGSRPKNPPMANADPTYGSIDGQGPRLMLRQAGQDWILFAVNEHNQGISFTVNQLPEELEGKILYRLYSEEKYLVKNKRFHDGIRRFGVHVYATSRRYETE
ncbi:hypothetical protein E2P42_00225 [Candidatus Bathyarchaeota archaeon]|nr:hypothetical protein E2P42_00225 [Candidatus Bathyarchaeota archaeon]